MFIQNRHIKLLLCGGLLFLNTILWGQDAVHNFGNLQFHATASVGFHIDLIDDGTFQNNMGLTGFYSANRLSVSGSSNPIFNDVEIVTDNGLLLETWMGVTNNLNFIVGDILTSKNNSNNYLNFIDNSFYTGTGNLAHINGYAGATNKEIITFPVGEGNRLRYLTLTSNAVNSLAKCAYYFEYPNNPSSIPQQFSTNSKEFDDIQISLLEFWKLESNQPSVVTLTWDVNSDVSVLAESIEGLLVVGWSKTKNRWERLGNSDITGNLQVGTITSEIFVPNEYEIITLGGSDDLLETFSVLELDNYFLTPNGDGINDFLLIDGIENTPNNLLNIYNRYGVMVYSKLNYTNEFNGVSNRNSVLSRDSGLSSGIYFYTLTVNDTRQKFQGYMYISD
ncbi:gliding motility-associated C-terminal domain-containing protein [Flagellimonas hymeniacidonis]|uniref:Gliding motility-associated C-terminal domain-containing protein n=1 Tax=Flagellimonas hymeniacidonis TaxID=2603628 RepID=A0A5C8V535_9FLAO|nr:gliding motility-associated C-terminal domain-containing protein [Flagellimonas hymeniacidonis]TXN36817.1 gliding motility-associated C-terminal domain-containing protein [Flagellimonas hymeniacidonis]